MRGSHPLFYEENGSNTNSHRVKLCDLRTAAICSCLAQLVETGMVSRDSRGYQLNPALQSPAVSLSPSIGPPGKRKRETLPLTTLELVAATHFAPSCKRTRGVFLEQTGRCRRKCEICVLMSGSLNAMSDCHCVVIVLTFYGHQLSFFHG
jgi:hypothetical protein